MNDGCLVHYGIKGQKHGERLYQNPDGSLTPLGRIRYGVGEVRSSAQLLTGDTARSYYKQKAKWKAEDAKKKVTDAYRSARYSPAGLRAAQIKQEAEWKAGERFLDACGLISDASLRLRGLDPKEYNK